MYDVEKLVSLVCELFDAEAEDKKYNLEVRKNKGYSPDAYLWVSTLGGSEAYRLGELAERSRQIGWSLATVCDMLDINQDWLIAAVKSMLRVAMVERQSIFLLTGATHMSRPVTMRSDFFCGWGLSLPAFFCFSG